MIRPPGTNGGSASGAAPPPDDPRLRALLAAAAENPAQAVDQVLALLRTPRITADLIVALSRGPVWMKVDRVRIAIVLHPATPRAVAMGLLSKLRWRDLARVAVAPALGAPLRGAAEKIILLRLPELALGEKVTLARAAPRKVLRALAGEDNTLVVRALFDNPGLRVEDVLAMVASPGMPGAALRFMAESPRFEDSQEIRLAIAAHPRTPPSAALRLVRSMDDPLLGRLLSLPDLPPLVAMAAARRAGILRREPGSNDV